MQSKKSKKEPLRIALLWQFSPFFAQRVLSGVYRQVGFTPEVVVRQFPGAYVSTNEEIAQPVVDWQPDGAIVRLTDPEDLRRWRELLPGIPFVSTTFLPHNLAEAVFSMDVREALTLALEHFQSRGVNHFAYLFGSVPDSAHLRRKAFFELAPHGYWHQTVIEEETILSKLPAEIRGELLSWLQSLPKPVGIICLEGLVGPKLIEFVQECGFAVPRDIQIIGADDVDQCLAYSPHISAVDAPCEKIGEQSFDAMMSMIHGASPSPMGHIEVSGAVLIPRGSTGLSSVGMERVASAVNLMKENILKGVSAGHLVKKAKVSHTTFYKQFRESTGTTPAKQLRENRLKKACEMLVKTDVNVSVIAEQCGFSGGNYFARFFRNAMGMTPREYREKHRK